jgi:hypothetical protein
MMVHHTGGVMPQAKIAITIDENLLTRLDRLVRERAYPSRSRAIQEALAERLDKIDSSRPQRAGFPLTLLLDDPRLPRKSWVNISQIRTISVDRIREPITTVGEPALTQVIEGLNEILGG